MTNCESCIHNHKMHEMTSPPMGCYGHGCQSDMLSGKSASSKENKLQNFCSSLPKCDHKPFLVSFFLLILSLFYTWQRLRWLSLFFFQPAHRLIPLILSLCLSPDSTIGQIILLTGINLVPYLLYGYREIGQAYHTLPGRLTHMAQEDSF